jgi:hypothetical protein
MDGANFGRRKCLGPIRFDHAQKPLSRKVEPVSAYGARVVFRLPVRAARKVTKAVVLLRRFVEFIL